MAKVSKVSTTSTIRPKGPYGVGEFRVSVTTYAWLNDKNESMVSLPNVDFDLDIAGALMLMKQLEFAVEVLQNEGTKAEFTVHHDNTLWLGEYGEHQKFANLKDYLNGIQQTETE
jgi:hypothetical protein